MIEWSAPRTPGSAARRQHAWRWQQRHFRAMNTDIHVWWYHQGDRSLESVERTFDCYEKHLSRFDPASELARLNRSHLITNRLSPVLFDAIAIALWAAQATGGIYDPTILKALERAGYDRSFEYLNEPPASASASALPSVSRPSYSFRDIHLDPQTREISKPVEVGLDLGGMGKGWTVDRIADDLAGEGPFLLNAGGDLYAYGSPSADAALGWKIELEHPLNPDRTLLRFNLKDQALATSAITRRRWQNQGAEKHHLIDPRSGEPARTDVLSATVVAARTLLAEIYAKTALILGQEQGLAYLQSLPDVEGVLYTDAGGMFATDNLTDYLI